MQNCVTILMILAGTLLYSQEPGTLRGQITDWEMGNEPLLMAQVALKDTARNTQTNFHGNFEIDELPAGNYALMVSYPGYETLELDIWVKEGETTNVQGSLFAKSLNADEITAATSSSVVGSGNPGGSSVSVVQSP